MQNWFMGQQCATRGQNAFDSHKKSNAAAAQVEMRMVQRK